MGESPELAVPDNVAACAALRKVRPLRPTYAFDVDGGAVRLRCPWYAGEGCEGVSHLVIPPCPLHEAQVAVEHVPGIGEHGDPEGASIKKWDVLNIGPLTGAAPPSSTITCQ